MRVRPIGKKLFSSLNECLWSYFQIRSHILTEINKLHHYSKWKAKKNPNQSKANQTKPKEETSQTTQNQLKLKRNKLMNVECSIWRRKLYILEEEISRMRKVTDT